MRQIKLNLLAVLAVFAVVLAVPGTASAGEDRIRIPLFAFEQPDPFASGHADFDFRDPRNFKFEVEVDDIFSTDLVDVWILDPSGENWTYVMTIPLFFGMGEVEHADQRGEFVPRIQSGDMVWVLSSYDYTPILIGQFP